MKPKIIKKETTVSDFYHSGLTFFNMNFLNWDFFVKAITNRLQMTPITFEVISEDEELDLFMLYDSCNRIAYLPKTPSTLEDYFTLAAFIRSIYQCDMKVPDHESVESIVDYAAFSLRVCHDYLGVTIVYRGPNSPAQQTIEDYMANEFCLPDETEKNLKADTSSNTVVVPIMF